MPHFHGWVKYSFFLVVILVSGYSTNAQTVNGTITDAENGEPIIGATILEMDTESNGTTTDFDGKFTLNLQT